MHAIVTVIHKEHAEVDYLFEKYLYDNERYYERNKMASKQEAIDHIEQRMAMYKQKIADPATPEDSKGIYANYVKEMMALDTEEKILDWFAEDNNYYYDEEAEEFYETYNPYGYCDWYVLGGRWSGSLVDYNGEGHDTIALKDFNPHNKESLQCPYAYLLDYRDDDYLYDDVTDLQWSNVLEEARTFAEQTGEELYITLVDIHM